MIIYINGIQAIPEDVIEASKVDGAGFWHTLSDNYDATNASNGLG